jgi:hypothetical protein
MQSQSTEGPILRPKLLLTRERKAPLKSRTCSDAIALLNQAEFAVYSEIRMSITNALDKHITLFPGSFRSV